MWYNKKQEIQVCGIIKMTNMTKLKQRIKAWFIPGTENDYKPHILRNKTLLIFAIFILCIKLAFVSFFAFFPNSAYFSVITANRLVQLTNQSREINNLPPLKVNEKLNQSAYFKAQDILEKNYFAHTSPQGITPWYWFKQADYNYSYAGENLAIDFLSAESLYEAWVDSLTHKANILSNKYDEIGIAVLTGNFNGRQTTIAVQHFGSEFVSSAIAEEPPALTPAPVPVAFNELEEKTLASSRETEAEPILTPQEEEIEKDVLQITQEKIKEIEKFTAERVQDRQTPKILGVIAEKSDEITQQVYIYSLIFVITALILNILIKFEVQNKKEIINALFIILLIVALILISNSTLLGVNTGII